MSQGLRRSMAYVTSIPETATKPNTVSASSMISAATKQKKRLHPKMEPYDRIEIQIESSGKWTREEENAICRVA